MEAGVPGQVIQYVQNRVEQGASLEHVFVTTQYQAMAAVDVLEFLQIQCIVTSRHVHVQDRTVQVITKYKYYIRHKQFYTNKHIMNTEIT